MPTAAIKAAARQTRERERVENATLRKARAALFRFRIDATRAFRAGRPVARPLDTLFGALLPLIVEGMVEGDLLARRRSILEAAQAEPIRLSLGPVDALAWLRKRNALNPGVRTWLEEQYGTKALRVLTEAQEFAEKRIAAKITEIVSQGLHVKPAMAALREALDAAGLGEVKDNTVETLVRTNTHLAYSAGQAAQDEHPAIADVLWGYRWVGENDSRERPNHRAMNGITLPKEHPFWRTHWSPAGFSCRCSVCRIIKDFPGQTETPRGVTIVEPAAKMIDGVMVEPDPDPGWGLRPTDLIA